jgi:hypothetical protein
VINAMAAVRVVSTIPTPIFGSAWLAATQEKVANTIEAPKKNLAIFDFLESLLLATR